MKSADAVHREQQHPWQQPGVQQPGLQQPGLQQSMPGDWPIGISEYIGGDSSVSPAIKR